MNKLKRNKKIEGVGREGGIDHPSVIPKLFIGENLNSNSNSVNLIFLPQIQDKSKQMLKKSKVNSHSILVI